MYYIRSQHAGHNASRKPLLAHAAVWMVALVSVLALAAAPGAHAAVGSNGAYVSGDDAYVSNGVDVLVMDVLANDRYATAAPIVNVLPYDYRLEFSDAFDARFGTLVSNGTHITYTPGSDPWNIRQPVYSYLLQDQPYGDYAVGYIRITTSPDGVIDAVDDQAAGVAGMPVLIDVLDNDINAHGATVAILTGPANGAADVHGDIIRYVPDPGYTGDDTITYTAAGTYQGSADTATVTVTVADSVLMAVDDDMIVRGRDWTPNLLDVRANDIGAAGATVEIVTPPRIGTATVVDNLIDYRTYLRGSGSLSYEVDTLQYRITFGNYSDTAELTVSRGPQSHYTAADDHVLTVGNRHVYVDVTENDQRPVKRSEHSDDPILMPIRLVADKMAIHGSISQQPDKTVKYVPAAGFAGTDRFMYWIHDNSFYALTADVHVTVLDMTVLAKDDTLLVDAGGPAVVDVLANDISTDDARIEIVTGPARGSATVTDGRITYVPEALDRGTDIITYRITDGDSSDPARVFITIEYDPVLAGLPTGITIPEHEKYAFDADLVEGADVPGHTFGLAGAPGGSEIDPSTGIFSWTPSEDQGGQSHTFAVTVMDGDGAMVDERDVTITVTEVNRPPVIEEIGNIAGSTGVPVTFDVNAIDTDTVNGGLRYVLDRPLPPGVSNGRDILDRNTGHFDWTPDGEGVYTFNLRVWDGQPGGKGQTRQSFTITVGANPPPVIEPIGDITAYAGQAVSFHVNATDIDTHGSLRYVLDRPLPPGVTDGRDILDRNTGHFDWTPDGEGVYTFNLRVWDGQPGGKGQTRQSFVVAVLLPDAPQNTPSIEANPGTVVAPVPQAP